MHKVTSEIYTENDQISEELDNGSKLCSTNNWTIKIMLNAHPNVQQLISDAVTEFTFKCPSYMIEAESSAETLNYDSDDDLDVDRDKEGVILIGTELIIVYSRVYKHIQ